MTKARNVVYQLLEDGPEEIDPKGFVDQYAQDMRPDRFMQPLASGFRDFFNRLDQQGIIQMLRKKYDDDVIAEVVMHLVLERSVFPQTRKAFLELKRLSQFRV